MKLFSCILSGALMLGSGAMGQGDYQYLYSSYLGPNDHFNSSGTRLNDACAIVQQDRANYHRFGIRDEQDSPDPVFGAREMRAKLGALCTMTPAFAREIVNGRTRYIAVTVRRDNAGNIIGVRVFNGAG